MFDRREQMASPGHHVEIDEALLAGKRKYNRGKLLRSNLPAERLPVDDPDRRDIENNRNHGARLSGPWIFGLAWRHQLKGKEVLECRYFVVERRN
jgi:hypothetical protein